MKGRLYGSFLTDRGRKAASSVLGGCLPEEVSRREVDRRGVENRGSIINASALLRKTSS